MAAAVSAQRATRPWGNAFVVAAAMLLALVAWRSRHVPPRATAPAGTPDLEVAKVDGLPVLDGELGDAIWQGAVARTGPLLDASGAPARPYADARIAWGLDQLSIALYAADEDIRTVGRLRDEFRITLGNVTFEVSATGELRGAPVGTRVGHDHDGTLDDPSDDDEEWALELTIPLASLDLRGRLGERLPLAVERCDTTRNGVRACSTTRPVVLVLAGPR